MLKEAKVHHLAFAQGLGCLKIIDYRWLNCVVQPLALALPDIITAIEAIDQADESRYEVIHIANVLFSSPIDTDELYQFVLCVTGCNTPLMSSTRPWTWKKSHSQLQHYPSTILIPSSTWPNRDCIPCWPIWSNMGRSLIQTRGHCVSHSRGSNCQVLAMLRFLAPINTKDAQQLVGLFS